MEKHISADTDMKTWREIWSLLLQVSQILYQIPNKYGLLQDLQASVRVVWQAEYLGS